MTTEQILMLVTILIYLSSVVVVGLICSKKTSTLRQKPQGADFINFQLLLCNSYKCSVTHTDTLCITVKNFCNFPTILDFVFKILISVIIVDSKYKV